MVNTQVKQSGSEYCFHVPALSSVFVQDRVTFPHLFCRILWGPVVGIFILVTCLFALCPRMEFLKVKYINIMNFQLFLHTILKEIHIRDTDLRARSLCCEMPLVDDQMFENLQTIIKCEQFQLILKRTFNNTYLQWTWLSFFLCNKVEIYI